MPPRWPRVTIAIVGALALVADAVLRGFADALPFATAYHPACAPLVTLGGLALLPATAAFAGAAPRRAVVAGLVAALAVLAGATVAYLAYHAHHGPTLVPDGFRGHLVPATPFHQQLAAPVFITLASATAILAAAVRACRPGSCPTTPARRTPPARSRR